MFVSWENVAVVEENFIRRKSKWLMIKNKEDVLAVFKIFDGIDIEDKFKYESKKYISDLVEYSHSFENSKKTPLCKIYCLGDIYIGQIRYFK